MINVPYGVSEIMGKYLEYNIFHYLVNGIHPLLLT